MVYVVLDLEPRASSMLDEHSPADAGGGGGCCCLGVLGMEPRGPCSSALTLTGRP